MKIIKTLVVVVIAGLAIWIWRAPLAVIYHQTFSVLFPCREVVTYRLGIIDPRFGLPTTTALADMKEAAGLWNAEHKGLLSYDQDHGAVVIDFTYDTRQETTQTLHTLGVALDDSRASYETLKAQYDSMHAQYSEKQATFAADNDAFRQDAARYEQEVAQWNERGGAPKSVYRSLETQKAHLVETQAALQARQTQINSMVDDINTLAATLNDRARALNLDVAKYNTIGGGTHGEFEQGVYESALGKRSITIFEYEDHVKLVRVLAHEMGHSLGFEHVPDHNAIMAELNQGTKIALAPDDVEELDRVCSLNPISVVRAKLATSGILDL